MTVSLLTLFTFVVVILLRIVGTSYVDGFFIDVLDVIWFEIIDVLSKYMVVDVSIPIIYKHIT